MRSPKLLFCALVSILISNGQGVAQQPPAPPSQARPVAQAYRLLFDTNIAPNGMMVVSIQPHSPVLDMRSPTGNQRGILELGDIITHVNKHQITSNDDYFQAMSEVRDGNENVELTVIDRSTGLPHPWVVRAKKVLVPVPGQPNSSLRKVHFILMGLTNDNGPRGIGPAMKTTLPKWYKLMDTVDSKRHGNIRVLDDDNCQAAKILDAVNATEVASRDTLFCVYCGHGAYDPTKAAPDDPSHGHYFQIPHTGDLMRKSLVDAMLAKNARLTVLISDTCNKPQPAILTAEESRTITTMGLSPFEELLFNYRGVVDISGTDFGQSGFCDPGLGAWFSASAIPVLNIRSDWRGAFDQMKRVVDDDFQNKKAQMGGIDQDHVTPKDFRFDVYRDEAVPAIMAEEPPQLKEVKYSVTREMAR